MSEERFFFPSSIESLIRGLGARATPELKRRLKDDGLDVDHLPPAIPIEQWVRHRRMMAVLAFPELSEAEAVRSLGFAFVRGWQNTPLGAAASMVLSVLGPARTLTRLDRAFRTTDNFTTSRVEMVGAHEALLSINEVHGYPTYWVGVLQGGLEVVRRKGAVTIHSETPPGVILRITWS